MKINLGISVQASPLHNGVPTELHTRSLYIPEQQHYFHNDPDTPDKIDGLVHKLDTVVDELENTRGRHEITSSYSVIEISGVFRFWKYVNFCGLY